MPFTPLHMGPGMAAKAACPRHFSLVVFGLTQIAIDCEVLWHLAWREHPLHTFCHTYLGTTIVAVLLTAVGKPASQWIKAAWNRLARKCSLENWTVRTRTAWLASCTGAFFGAYCHVFLDSLSHSDIQPLQPWTAVNPFRGAVPPRNLPLTCVLLGIAGLVWFFARVRREGKASRASSNIHREAPGPK
jgi:hypothetical protein